MEDSRHAKQLGVHRQSWWALAARGSVVARALKVSAVVGTLLVCINQGDALIAGAAVDWAKFVLNYAVPYGVSTFSAVAALRVNLPLASSR